MTPMSKPGRSRKLIAVVLHGIRCFYLQVSCLDSYHYEELPDVMLGNLNK